MATKMVTVAEYAEMRGVIPRRIRQLLTAGRIPGAQKIGRDWLIPESAAIEERPAGWPRGKARGPRKKAA